MGDKEVEELARTYPKFKAFAGEVEVPPTLTPRTNRRSFALAFMGENLRISSQPPSEPGSSSRGHPTFKAFAGEVEVCPRTLPF